MSTIGRFVQVGPDQLKQIQDNPSSITELFEVQELAPHGPVVITDAMRQAAIRTMPQALAASLARMDPATRAAMAQRLEALGASAAIIHKTQLPRSAQAPVRLHSIRTRTVIRMRDCAPHIA